MTKKIGIIGKISRREVREKKPDIADDQMALSDFSPEPMSDGLGIGTSAWYIHAGVSSFAKNRCDMSCDPSYQSPPLVFDPDPPSLKATTSGVLMPGKESGIRSLVYGTQPLAAVVFAMAAVYCSDKGLVSDTTEVLMGLTASILLVLTLPCATAGIVFGIIGRNTEGKLYANIGLTLSLLFCALLVAVIVVSSFSFMMALGVLSRGRCC